MWFAWRSGYAGHGESVPTVLIIGPPWFFRSRLGVAAFLQPHLKQPESAPD
jgi:hypothetical protein